MPYSALALTVPTVVWLVKRPLELAPGKLRVPCVLRALNDDLGNFNVVADVFFLVSTVSSSIFFVICFRIAPVPTVVPDFTLLNTGYDCWSTFSLDIVNDFLICFGASAALIVFALLKVDGIGLVGIAMIDFLLRGEMLLFLSIFIPGGIEVAFLVATENSEAFTLRSGDNLAPGGRILNRL
jgi:hypothetical protein